MNDDLTPDQGEALSALKSARGSCPSAETLLDYGELSADDRARHPAHDHISICSRCQLALLHSAEPPAVTMTGMRWWLPLAAVLVLGVAASIVWRSNSLAPNVPPDTVRGTEIQLLGPIGTVDAIDEFSWQSPITADHFRITVMRGSDQVWSGETTTSRIAPPAVFVENLEYRWSVEAIDREGEVRMTSPSRSFTYSRRK